MSIGRDDDYDYDYHKGRRHKACHGEKTERKDS